MKKAIFLVIGLVLAIAARAYAFDNHDFQVWNTDSEEVKLNKNSKLLFEQEFRWGDNASRFYYQHYDIGYQYSLNKYFSLGGGFRYIKEKKSQGNQLSRFRDESDPYFASFMNYELYNWKLADRVRIEYRYYDYQVNSWRFRNKFDIKSPWKFTRFKIQPLIADEIFFRFNGIDLNENRLYAGFAFALTKNLSGEITYLWKTNKSVNTCVWTDTNVMSAKLKLAF